MPLSRGPPASKVLQANRPLLGLAVGASDRCSVAVIYLIPTQKTARQVEALEERLGGLFYPADHLRDAGAIAYLLSGSDLASEVGTHLSPHSTLPEPLHPWSR